MGELFEKPARNFAPRTIWTGDNLDILRGLNSETVDLIYLDPPFNSNKTYSAPIGSKAAGAAFKDSWTLDDLDVAWLGLIAERHPAMYRVIEAAGTAHSDGMKAYLCMMGVRLVELRRVLKPTGSIYLHCDPTASHYLKLLMDAVFGRDNFRNEVIWSYNSRTMTTKWFAKKHDVLIFYAREHKGMRFYPDAVRIPYRPESLVQYNQTDAQGRRYKAQSGGQRTYINEAGQPCPDVWDIQLLGSRDKERTGYPTQKPLTLLDRIVKASSKIGSVVLDPFCGCATALVAAEQQGREWLGIDISAKAVDLVRQRLKDTLGDLYHAGMVTARTDIPQRTDIESPIPYRLNKHVLFGQQEGLCAGCRSEFPYRAFEVDHMIPQSRGGTDHIDNLQLLCSSCNRIKGNRPMEYLMARLAEYSRSA